MTPERLEEIHRQNARDIGTAMHSGCDDYACYCHFNMPEVLAELDRLRAAEGAAAAERMRAACAAKIQEMFEGACDAKDYAAAVRALPLP